MTRDTPEIGLKCQFMGALYTAGSTFIGFPFSVWWCTRQYYRTRGKGYYLASAATLAFGGMAAAFVTTVVGMISLGSSTWPDTLVGMSMLSMYLVPALVVTALVTLLPHRPRRAGQRKSSFLSSSACRALEVGLVVACIAVAGLQTLSTTAEVNYISGHSPTPPHLTPGELGGIIGILAFSVAALEFARRRLDASGLAETMTADTRPAVLYIRPFRQESDPFFYVPPNELPRYTRRGRPASSVTFEQYLGAEFTRQLGPFVALGNPLDSVPPEGAVRDYAPDEDWQHHFRAHAGASAAIVTESSLSDNLHWELAEIIRKSWQHKLFFLTAPAPPTRGRARRHLLEALRRSVKDIRPRRWEHFAETLKSIGLYVPPSHPGPGSITTFDTAGRAEVLVSGVRQPEEFVTVIRTHLRSRRGPSSSKNTVRTSWSTFQREASRQRETGNQR